MLLKGNIAFEKTVDVEWLPSVTTTSGRMISICLSRYGVQVSISRGLGSRFLGGLHFTTFVMKTCFLENPICNKSASKNLPAVPTKGSPLTSSDTPGASPMNIIRLFGFPMPGTAFLRDFQSGHFVQIMTSEATASRSSFVDKATLSRYSFLSISVLIKHAR